MSFSVNLASSDWAVVLMLLMVVVILIHHLYTHRLAQAAFDWHPVQAVLTEVFMKTRSDEGEEEHAPHVKYEYRFKGRVFTRKRLQYGNLWNTDYAVSSALLRSLRVGETVTVYINPHKPGQATIKPGYHGNIKVDVLIHCVLLCVLLAFVWS